MKNAIDFVRFALSHAKRETIPAGAQIPLDIEECGTSPWEYLFGTTGNIVTQDRLTDVFRNITANAAGPVKGSTAQPKTGPHAE